MLNGIPKELSPDLVKAMMEMGHGDEILIGDANYPAAAQGVPVVRADGISVPVLLDAILKLMPLDLSRGKSVKLMAVQEGDPVETPIWDEFKSILKKHGCEEDQIEFLERFDYYKESKKCFVIVQSGETALYANLILRKGCVIPE